MKSIILCFVGCFTCFVFAHAQLRFVQKSAYPISDADSVICYYYPIKENMANAQSPFYKSKPTLSDILKVAEDMPCDSFAVQRSGKTILTLSLKKDSTWRFVVLDKLTGKSETIPSELYGAMTEHRTIDLINNGYDKNAGQVFGKFNFDKKQMVYITTANLENAVRKTVDGILNSKSTSTTGSK